jgi:hypothetical protein
MRRKVPDEYERQIIRLFCEVFSELKQTEGETLLKEEKAFTSSTDLEYWMNCAERVARLRRPQDYDS